MTAANTPALWGNGLRLLIFQSLFLAKLLREGCGAQASSAGCVCGIAKSKLRGRAVGLKQVEHLPVSFGTGRMAEDWMARRELRAA